MMTDKQGSKMGAAGQVPAADRPLTAGDVHLLREGDVLRDYAGRTCVFDHMVRDDYLWARIGEGSSTGAGIGFFTFVRRPAASDEGVAALVKELRLAACSLFELKNDRGDYGYFDTLADRIAALASPPVSERERELEGALRELQDVFAHDGECSMERFERLAEMFRRDTGYLAPGKDPGMCSVQPEGDELRRIYDDWFAAKVKRARSVLTAQPAGEGK